jgi:hypothetical protein
VQALTTSGAPLREHKDVLKMDFTVSCATSWNLRNEPHQPFGVHTQLVLTPHGNALRQRVTIYEVRKVKIANGRLTPKNDEHVPQT